MQNIVNKKLIFDNFEGKVTALEKMRIDEWILLEGNQELFFQWLQQWENEHLQFTADKEAALGRYQQFLNNADVYDESSAYVQEEQISNMGNLRKWWLGIAAGFAACFLLWKSHDQVVYYSCKTGFNQKKLFVLEDGSRVALNSNSTLLVPRISFFVKERRVKLEGEALFSVQHTKDDKKFVVETANGEQVVVLGTEFDLFSRSTGTRVVLQKGKVELHYKKPGREAGQLTMKPGELAAVGRDGVASVKPVDQPSNSSEWLYNRYVFEQSSIEEITQIFKDNFGINITTSDPEIAAMTLSGAYPYENADDLLTVITQALNLQMTQVSHDTYLLTQEPVSKR